MVSVNYKKYFDIDAILNDIKEYLPNFDRKRFLDAFSFAEKAHRGQMRKDEVTPYIVHPVNTVKILVTLHADEDTLISALLHDVPEDTKYEIHNIKDLFGTKIAFLVDGITKLSKVQYKHNMPERQIESLKKLLLHTAEDLRVVIIKLADRLHNMQTLQNIKKPEKRLRIASETLEIYVPIANLLGIRELKSQLEDLCFKYLFPTEYKELCENLEASKKKRENISNKFIEVINKGLRENKIKGKISIRHKNLYSIYKKLCSLGKTIGDVDDRIGVVIIAEKAPECYQVLGIVHSKFVPKTDRFKDYISNPKTNDYQSLHSTVFGVDGVLTEVQIRTEKMNIEAEYGIAANFFYRSEGKDLLSSDLKRSAWVKQILEMEKTDKSSDDFIEDLKLDIFQDRIFVFTPKGEPIDLPKGATVIDFAYAIHTDIGRHASKADINGQLRPITTTLNTRDVVSVKTSKGVAPELSWLSFAKTSLAKNKILSYLKRISVEKKIMGGHKILQKEFDIYGLGICQNVNFKKLKIRLKEMLDKNFKNISELFIAICEGDVKAINVVRALEKDYKHARRYTGKMTDKDFKKGIRVYMKVVANNRFGLLRDISEVLYKHAINMYSLKGWASKFEKTAYFTSQILVEDLETVSHIFDELEQIEDVRSVYRISRKGLYLFSVGVTFIGIAWIFHPLILRFLGESEFQESNPIISGFVLYAGLFSLIFMVLYLTSVVKKYFPIVRNAARLWFIAFTIPIIAIIALAIELLIFDLTLSWLAIFLEVTLIYGYIGLSYLNFKKTTRRI